MSASIDTSHPLKVVRGVPVRRRALTGSQLPEFVALVAKSLPATATATELAAAVKTAHDAFEGEDLKLGDALIDALLGSRGASEGSGADKLKRWKLARQIEEAMASTDPRHILAIGDVDFLSACAAEHYPAAVYGAIHDCLNAGRKD